jgi:hypothetical protein
VEKIDVDVEVVVEVVMETMATEKKAVPVSTKVVQVGAFEHPLT